MIWQDAVIAAGELIFVIALIPAMLSASKPPRSTCAITSAVLFIYAGTFASLNLWWGAWMTFLGAACWAMLLFQRRTA